MLSKRYVSIQVQGSCFYYPLATRCGVVCLIIKLAKHVHYDERINPIDYGGQWSKIKVTIDIFGNKLVNKINNKPLCALTLNLAYMLAIVRGLTLLISIY